MNADWLLIGVIAAQIAIALIAFVLGACWQAGEADARDEEVMRQIAIGSASVDQLFRNGARPDRRSSDVKSLRHFSANNSRGQQDHA